MPIKITLEGGLFVAYRKRKAAIPARDKQKIVQMLADESVTNEQWMNYLEETLAAGDLTGDTPQITGITVDQDLKIDKIDSSGRHPIEPPKLQFTDMVNQVFLKIKRLIYSEKQDDIVQGLALLHSLENTPLREQFESTEQQLWCHGEPVDGYSFVFGPGIIWHVKPIHWHYFCAPKQNDSWSANIYLELTHWESGEMTFTLPIDSFEAEKLSVLITEGVNGYHHCTALVYDGVQYEYDDSQFFEPQDIEICVYQYRDKHPQIIWETGDSRASLSRILR